MTTTPHVPPTRRQVSLIVSREQALDAMRYARAHDVEHGGVYDARSAVINIWSLPWDTPENHRASEIVGSISLYWNTPHAELATIYEFDAEPGCELAAVEQHIPILFDPGHQGKGGEAPS